MRRSGPANQNLNTDKGGPAREQLQSALPARLLLGVDHVGIAVADLDEAIFFHTTILGGRVTHREENVEQGVSEAMIGYNTGAQIQLLAPPNPRFADCEVYQSEGARPPALAYRVSNIDEVSYQLSARGIRLLYSAPRRGTAGSSINFLHPKDTGGVLVELVQIA